MVTVISAIACWINWGFGLVVGAIFAKEIAARVKDVDYRLLIASAYSGFLFSAILLHGTPKSLLNSVSRGVRNCAGILLQFPFYAGIMGMMTAMGDSGVSLAGVISQAFVSISNETTFPLFTFLSAGIVNFFVPSGDCLGRCMDEYDPTFLGIASACYRRTRCKRCDGLLLNGLDWLWRYHLSWPFDFLMK